MRRQIACLVGALLLVGAGASTAFGQLSTEGPVVYGHHHFYVSSIDVQKKFWVDTLGGEDAGRVDDFPVSGRSLRPAPVRTPARNRRIRRSIWD